MPRLRTYVSVDGVTYGPGDDVAPEVAARITNPNAWEDGPDVSGASPTTGGQGNADDSPPDGDDPGAASSKPRRHARSLTAPGK